MIGHVPGRHRTKAFLYGFPRLIAAQYAPMVTAGHASPAFARFMGERAAADNDPAAVAGYLTMYTATDFSAEAKAAGVGTPIRVILGALDLPFFTEAALRESMGSWFPNIEFRTIGDAGHYVMMEAPVYFAFLVEEFLRQHP